jgi:hypothetical protein
MVDGVRVAGHVKGGEGSSPTVTDTAALPLSGAGEQPKVSRGALNSPHRSAVALLRRCLSHTEVC